MEKKYFLRRIYLNFSIKTKETDFRFFVFLFLSFLNEENMNEQKLKGVISLVV